MLTKYKIILFDVDGTLLDPKTSITKSVQYALGKMGIRENNLDKLLPFIGPPLQDSFKLYYFGSNKNKVWQAIKYYRSYFSKKGTYEYVIYESIMELLNKLHKRSQKLIVATSKLEDFAKNILTRFDLDKYFDCIVGATYDGKRSSKTDVIKEVLKRYPNVPVNEFIMIGDTKHDIKGAKNTQMDSIGVSYGYGSEKEIKKAKPTFFVKTVSELQDLLL